MVMLGTDMKVAETPKEGLKDYAKTDPYGEWLERKRVKLGPEFTSEFSEDRARDPGSARGAAARSCTSPIATCPMTVTSSRSSPGANPSRNTICTSSRSDAVSGRGATTIWQDEKHKSSFEWQAGSLFSIPLNAWYQNFNGSGQEPTRYIAVTNAPPMMRLFRDNEFIFDNNYMFTSRYAGEEDYFSGKGKLFNGRCWESNFIANAPDMLLYGWKERGTGGINAMLEMANNNTKSHISEFPIGTYKKAHRHGPGAHLVLLSGTGGYSLIWTKDDRSDMIKCDWQVGSMVTVPNDNCCR